MDDWNAVLADPDNHFTDPQGTTAPSSDRDFRVPSEARDLLDFAYTWDTNKLCFYVRRAAPTGNVHRIVVYVDRDDDGFMESSDRAVRIRWWG
ncbi:MAG: hypothetical protein ACE5G2_06610, partial [Candidatus Krumholzibacteriia bacterium]